MAKYDSADLLDRCQRGAQRPTTDVQQTTADWYAFLTEAQDEWFTHIASIAPDVLYGDPVVMTTTDNGLTYTFGTDADGDPIFPMGHIELRSSPNGAVLHPTTDWGNVGDFLLEGDRIRFPNGSRRTFGTGGPVARFITPPNVISASVQPVLKPKQARMLLVYRALAKWARRGGLRDPQPYLDQEQELWLGNPDSGVMGILGMLKTQANFSGMAATAPMDVDTWWRGIDTGSGYGRGGAPG